MTVKSGSEKDTLEKLKKVPEVRDVYLVYGEYDLILKVELKEISDLSEFVIARIRALPIDRTTTLIVAG
ncbi:MAG TPA: Lrp/AsnC ligand binding domain-containing protein [Candidatus Nanoarchaeia archaeon]|nr:Lrp/AsnC ligand binding domain-containing protein [Candidatus Nanoarchaeia archaeon]